MAVSDNIIFFLQRETISLKVSMAGRSHLFSHFFARTSSILFVIKITLRRDCEFILRYLKAHFQPWCNARREPISCNTKFPDLWKPSKIVFLNSHPSQLFNGKYIRRSSFYSFLTVFWILSGRIRSSLFLSVTHGSLRTLCTRSAKRITLEFFHFLEALEDCKWR